MQWYNKVSRIFTIYLFYNEIGFILVVEENIGNLMKNILEKNQF